MTLENFTIKAQEAVQQAVQHARRNGQQVIEPVHLLKGVLEKGKDVTTFIFHTSLGLLTWGGVVIFTLYIGYDWARAQAFPKTANNAICSAADIYVDIINLFLLILRLMDRK